MRKTRKALALLILGLLALATPFQAAAVEITFAIQDEEEETGSKSAEKEELTTDRTEESVSSERANAATLVIRCPSPKCPGKRRRTGHPDGRGDRDKCHLLVEAA